eukprot:CAMPEP_0197323994 /NCGR_PEP_ID=MMETSP0891-20130614/70849_1 /TAXON_ID=44058 ORGANISM="Aureoumbra lagunensis, Strain CCMP1510" /NCGR_SAMPLE_ID=MMETSP0891 /ASSEMBLY_ACC=CAM_ASM_000534 /LENGTH=333 /DNA_ID=CAMNT_0042816739 /DNA_START=651 /DNA_END=1653 /DNA_ORIENTATION=-
MENDVFTGRHRTRTTVFAIQQAKWDEKWNRVLVVAKDYAKILWSSESQKLIADETCLQLVDMAQKYLPGVGSYIGAHLVRSLLALFGLYIPTTKWGAFVMSEDSVGVMLQRLDLSPAHLADELAFRLESLGSPRAASFRNEYRRDAGVLSLVLCELHGCCSLVERHRVTKHPWSYESIMHLLEAIPHEWVPQVRKILSTEYNRPDLFHPDKIYHAANKLLLNTMIGLGRHDVLVLRHSKRMHNIPAPTSPSFKLVTPPPPAFHDNLDTALEESKESTLTKIDNNIILSQNNSNIKKDDTNSSNLFLTQSSTSTILTHSARTPSPPTKGHLIVL